MTSSRPAYALAALFDSPDALLHAAESTTKAGYTKFDAHTPYPVHGLDRAMKLKPSKLGFFAFGFGLLGTFSALSLISWVALKEYPLVIGGKPFWSWPAFVPVSFELTVLLASVLSTVTMIVLYFKFPNNAHPLHDTPYMKAVSSNKFGIAIQVDDPRFEEKAVRELFKALHAVEVLSIEYDPEEAHHGQKLLDGKFLSILAVTALVVITATYVTLNYLLYLPPFDFMMVQKKLKAQQPSELFKDGKGMQPPVEGTVARGFIPYAYTGKPDEAGKNLINPLLPTASTIERGKSKFLVYCSPCHDNFGTGNSRLRGQFPNPPTLHSDKVRNWPDGNLYHVITEGQNVMPAYASQISREDRWAVVHYIRVLQRAHNAKESDLK